jgi:hypothetical protein
VAGSLAAGDEVSGKAVLAEMLGEVGTGSVEVATGAVRERVQGEGRASQTTAPGAQSEIAQEVNDPAQSAAPSPAETGEVYAPFSGKKPKFGDSAETLAAAINRRPVTDFKETLAAIEGPDVDLVGQLARYGEETLKTNEDFPAFAERMGQKFGDKVQAYLPRAWEAVNGETAVKDIVAGENPIQVETGWKRAAKFGRLFWEGSADVLRRAGVNSLANAIDAHVDFEDRNLARAWGVVKPAVAKISGRSGLVNRSRRKIVLDEFAAFYRARENGRPEEAQQILNAAHPETRKLLGAVQQMFVETGKENRRLGVRVRDAKTGELRPIGFLGADNFPRFLKDDVLAVLRDPSSDPKRWEEMRAELVRNGNVPSRDEAGQVLTQAVPDESSSDYFGSLEKARAARLPESWYEYDFWKVIPRYVQSWAERTAQIEAFGQKIAETDRDAFDVAAASTRNPEAQRYIMAAKEHAYRVNRMDRSARKAIGNATSLTSMLFLANPYSTLRNLIGGTAQTFNQYGPARAIAELRGAWRGIPEAESAGALKADVADLLFNDDATPPLRRLTSLALKASGFSVAESFVRSHGFLTAKTFLRDALRSMESAPDSRKSLQARAFLKRYGFDADKLATESMKGPETERFLRKSVREAQGGYRYDQVPLFTNGPLGRFLIQFARWGTQATRFQVNNILKPALVGEDVPIRRADGKIEMRRVRTLLPLLRSPLVAAAAGATTYAMREALFGMDRPDASWEEVWKTLEDDEREGMELALNRMTNDIVMGGTFGALTDYAAMLRDVAQRGRYKNPVEPPAASLVKETGVLAYKLARQGTLSARDYREYVGRMLTAYRYGSAAAYRFANAAEADWAEAKRFQADQDKRFVRAVGRRFGEQAGYDQPGASGGLPRVTENTPHFDEIEDALLAGEAGRVRRLVNAYVKRGKTETERGQLLLRVRQSLLGRQPIKPGGEYGREDQAAFRAWARQRLPADEQKRIREVQTRWFRTGRRAGIFSDADLLRYSADSIETEN